MPSLLPEGELLRKPKAVYFRAGQAKSPGPLLIQHLSAKAVERGPAQRAPAQRGSVRGPGASPRNFEDPEGGAECTAGTAGGERVSG